MTACAEGTLIYWDPRSPTPVFKLSPQDARFDLDGITSLAVNPSSTLVVVGGTSGSIRVVSLSKGEVVGALGGHAEGESVEAIQFVDLAGTASSPGVVITGATDGKACIWDVSTMRLRATLEHQVCSIVFCQRVVSSTLAGRDHERDSPPCTEEPSGYHCVCRQNAKDVGRSNGDADQGTHGSLWTSSRCVARTARLCGGERWRRWRLSCIYDRSRARLVT